MAGRGGVGRRPGAGAAGKAPTLQRARGGGLRGPGTQPTSPPAQPTEGAGWGRVGTLSGRGSRHCGGGASGGPPGEGRGKGAWRSSALQCGGGNRFQSVLLLAQRALLAPGTERSLSRLEGLPAGLGARCRGATLRHWETNAPSQPTLAGRGGGCFEPSFLSPHHRRSCLPPHHLPSQPPATSSRRPSAQARLGISGAPTSLTVGVGACVSLPPCQMPPSPRHCLQHSQARHPRLAHGRTSWCLQPLATPGFHPQGHRAWREPPGLGPLTRWQPTSASGSEDGGIGDPKRQVSCLRGCARRDWALL